MAMLKYLEGLGAVSGKSGSGSRAWKAVHNQLLQRVDFPATTVKCPGAGINKFYRRPLKGITPEELEDLKKELTVTPRQQQQYGDVKSFNVYKKATHPELGDFLVVPRFYGIAKWGWPTEPPLLNKAAPMGCHVQFAGKLRPVQEEATQAVLQCLRDTGGALLIKDCGMGKTVDGTYVAMKLGMRTGVLVHNEDLALQWKERLLEHFPTARVGLVQQDRVEYEGMDYVIFMVQSLTSRTSAKAREKGKQYPDALFDSIGFLIVDEAHHIGAKSFCDAVCLFCPKYTLAMTATPTRKDGQAHLISWFMGPTAFEKEHDCKKQVTVVVHRYEKPRKEIRYKNGIVARALMVGNMFKDPVRNASIVDRLVLRIQEGRKIMVLGTYHCSLNTVYRLLKERLPDVDARFYTGKVEKKLRPAALEAQVIFATTPKGDEALDCPALDTLFRIDPVTESKQAVGRLMRDYPDKQPLVVEHWWDTFSIFNGMFHNCKKYYRKKNFILEELPVRAPTDTVEVPASS